MLTEKSSDPPEGEPVVGPSETAAPPDEQAPPPAEESPAENIMETVPVSEEAAEEAGAAGQLLEACPACGTLMNVTEQAPFAKIFCPSCGQGLHARKQFNNYRLVEFIGEGGMGSVFKAIDCNLNRSVALKILKKECSANAEERAKLEQEARVTASINHPHVVKVFSFGEDHGQFYLAMELVEKGTLDNLMNIQRRIAEAQMLEVGIQIAEGLEAALERGLIHRDIKPGNILFSDPHTSKLVDFGLAIVMDDAARVTGEIWGTPYYIAPEKLDNLPEDFRSDIYSLGGTLFHALSGRPPYEAETASMVALKQLKSQPISLQAFAPDVSSETAYVINRMLAKHPDDRYNSYRELVEHLSYARHKLLERAQKPHRPKERVVLETQSTKNLTAFLSLGILLAILAAGAVLFFFRHEIFGTGDKGAGPGNQPTYSAGEVRDMFRQGVRLLADRQFDDARTEFNRLAESPGLAQPEKNWILMNEALATLLGGDPEKAASIFEGIYEAGLYSHEADDSELANFFAGAAQLLSKSDKIIPASTANLYSSSTEAFGLLCFAMHDWEIGQLQDAGSLLNSFMQSKPPASESWIEDYKPLAAVYLADYNLIAPIEAGLEKARSPAEAKALLAKLATARENIQTGSRATDKLDALEQALAAKGAN